MTRDIAREKREVKTEIDKAYNRFLMAVAEQERADWAQAMYDALEVYLNLTAEQEQEYWRQRGQP